MNKTDKSLKTMNCRLSHKTFQKLTIIHILHGHSIVSDEMQHGSSVKNHKISFSLILSA